MKKTPYLFLVLLCSLMVGCTQKIHAPHIPLPPKEPVKTTPKEVDPVYIKAVHQKNVAQKSLPTLSTMIVVGENEPVFIKGMASPLAARIDTGATTSSISATKIKRFERDGKAWVSFVVVNKITDEQVTFEKPVNRTVLVKRHGEESLRRVVVKLQVRLGEKAILREFSLTDRSAFDYPVLVGRNVLSGLFVVDVSRKNITSVMQEGVNDN